MEKANIIEITIAGLSIKLISNFGNMTDYFSGYLNKTGQVTCEAVSILPMLKKEWEDIHSIYDAYAEYNIFHVSISCMMMNYNRFLFHSAAFICCGKAWLLTGKSGVGKTTQYKNLRQLYPDEIEIINGDKPALEIFDNGKIIVHPSPWNGKENYKGTKSAELGGIIVLKQSSDNYIKQLNYKEAVIPVFTGIIQIYQNEKMINKTAEYAEKLITQVPVYQFENKGNYESTELLYKVIIGKIE